MDSMPTNFNKRDSSTAAQNDRVLQRYRHVMTAGGGKRAKPASQTYY